VYAGVNRSLTADARRLFAIAALPADYFLRRGDFCHRTSHRGIAMSRK
jgi:hypothetical protein